MPKLFTDSSPLHGFAPDNSVQTGLQANREFGALFSSGALSVASAGRLATSVRGLDDPSRSVSTFGEVVRGSGLSVQQKDMLHKVWEQARINGRDVGKDISELVPLLERRPELLEKLHQVATAGTLFGVEKDRSSEEAFEAMRREFLVEVIRGSVNPQLLAQGETSTCTACKGLSSTSAENILALSCGLAIDGRATTVGGDRLGLGRSASDFQDRLIPYAERVSGTSLQGDGGFTRTVDSVTSRLPSFGMALVYASIMEMRGGDVTDEKGQYARDYTYMHRSLSGFDSAVAGSDARILVNGEGQAVLKAGAGVREVSQIEYLNTALARISRDSESAATLTQGSDQGHERGVLVDMKWIDVNPAADGTRRHGRHFLLATGVERDPQGQEWYRLENPIGDYRQSKDAPGGSGRFHPPGTELGDKNSIWWKSGEDGILYVRKDVMERNLVTLMVQYGDRYDASQGAPVRMLGTLDQHQTTYDDPIYFVKPAPQAVSGAQGVSSSTDQKKTPEEEKRKTLAEMALEQQAAARRNGQEGEESSMSVEAYRRARKAAETVVKDYDTAQEQAFAANRKEVDDESRFLSFVSRTSTPVTPPPPPTASPAEVAQQRKSA